MIKRVIEVSHAGTRLSVRLGQLVVARDGAELGRIPCEDVGVLLVDHAGVVYTHTVFTELLQHGAAVVLCNGSHHPAGMLLPIESNGVQTERFRKQIAAKEPLKKQLWKQVVQAKIRHQAHLVRRDEVTYRWLKALERRVRSGDPENIEAQASKRFWAAYLPETTFRRDRGGAVPNNLLNYGYMVLRAAVARALCSAGLLPSLGIHHRNRYNAFCLADDMMEPFRGFAEKKVRDIFVGASEDLSELDQTTKAKLLEVLYEPVTIGGYEGPLMVGLHRTAASLVRCYAGQTKRLELPEI
jgi:CRISPR-associated protein Cas1